MKVALAFGVAVILFSGSMCTASASDVPTFESVRDSFRPSDLSLLDRRGRLLHERRTDPQRRRFGWVPLDEISPALLAAVIVSEDRRFRSHDGVDYAALASAAVRWLGGAPPRGASTITMQLAALLRADLRRGSARRSASAKLRQMEAAWELEEKWTKEQILEAYLNILTFRGEVQGVAAAAGILFGKLPHGLTEPEAAVLASLIRSPNAVVDDIDRRARTLLVAQSLPVREAELVQAVTRAATDHAGPTRRVAQAPHVARRLLRSDTPVQAVTSTLDLDLQRLANAALRRQLLVLDDRQVGDGAVLVADNATGDVIAYVGSSGTLSGARHVDGVRAFRQPGSALKPFLYALAIEQRLLTAASLLEDTPLEIPVATGLYRPENYDGFFRGLVSLRTALASSLNLPAVRTLRLLGEEVFVRHLRDLGFSGLERPGSYYGPALALGSAEVSLWEIVNAYRTLANRGRAGELGLMPGGQSPSQRRVYSEEAAFVVATILADREGRSLTFGLESPLATRFWAAVKTGTSKDMRDNWCVGFSQRYTVGVWVGNFSGQPMGDVSGVSGAAPIWSELMHWLHRETPSIEPVAPPGIVRRSVHFATDIEAARPEYFVRGTAPIDGPQSLATHRARILKPTDGTVIAPDPGIPPSHQRVVFEAQADDAGLSWVLDGDDIGAGRASVLWPPVPGAHELSLIDAAGRTVDRVAFRVRDTAPMRRQPDRAPISNRR